ncbi:ATP-binding protein [Methanobrevibacter sp. UBA212]|uniref:AAA family ATPase n=1 Tax=Methanobrevibacter sp. UBA212 TaxID=1915476 RepID=UPI0025F89CC4|nr:ATP-binding protein [Methanobrevibacter sp. UBA212]
MNELAWGTNNDLNENQFYNRVEDIKFISDLLRSSQYGTSPSILLTGIRGVGKSALMKRIQKNFRDENYLVVYIDLSSSNAYQTDEFTRESLIELIYDEIIKECGESGITTVDKKIEKYIKTHDVALKEIVNIKGYPVPFLWTKKNYKKLANFVMELPQYLYDEYKEDINGVFLFFDEFQIIKELGDELTDFLWYMRSYIQKQNNVSYVFSGSMSVKDNLIEEIAGSNGAFGGRMLTIEIKPFSYETTKNYLNEKADYLKFTDDGFDQFYTCTKGIPFYINTFGNLLPRNVVLDASSVKENFIKFLHVLAMHFSNSWFRLNLQEQKILTTLLDESLNRSGIAKKLNVTSGAIGRSLNRLLNNGFIEMENNKYYMPNFVFKAWLKNEYQTKGVYPYKSI